MMETKQAVGVWPVGCVACGGGVAWGCGLGMRLVRPDTVFVTVETTCYRGNRSS